MAPAFRLTLARHAPNWCHMVFFPAAGLPAGKALVLPFQEQGCYWHWKSKASCCTPSCTFQLDSHGLSPAQMETTHCVFLQSTSLESHKAQQHTCWYLQQRMATPQQPSSKSQQCDGKELGGSWGTRSVPTCPEGHEIIHPYSMHKQNLQTYIYFTRLCMYNIKKKQIYRSLRGKRK